MIGLVVITHAGLATSLVRAATMITGELERCVAVELHPEDPADLLLSRLKDALAQVGNSNTIIMTDMFGGTPSNVAMSFLASGTVEVLTGVNLPMMVEFFARRERLPLEELAQKLQRVGRDSVIIAGELLK